MTDNTEKLRLFHYTYAHKLESIRRAGGLEASNPGARILNNGIEVDRKNSTEKRVLWFSSNRSFEQTAVKKTMEKGSLVRGNFLEHAGTIGLVRFELTDPSKHDILHWKDLGPRAGITHSQRQKMEKIGRAQGANPNEWYGIILEDRTLFMHWLSMQRLDVSGEKPTWKPTTLNDEIERFQLLGMRVKSI
mgnify:CR=1 FL=1